MKLKAALPLGICMAVLVAAAGPADARSTTAFNSFHVQSGSVLTDDAYLCLTEDNGAVVNNCAFSVNLLFDLQIDTTGKKNVKIQDYWGGPRTFTPFSCLSYVYAGKSSSSLIGTEVTFTGPLDTLTTQDTVPAEGDSLTVICWQVPPGEGIANLNWNQ